MAKTISENEIIWNESSERGTVGQMWKHAFIFSRKNPHLSLDKIMKMTLEHWCDDEGMEEYHAELQDARQRFISEFKYYFDIL